MYGVACSLILINDAASSFIRIHVQRWGLGTVHWITRRKTKEENWSCIPASLPSGRSCWFSRCSTTWTLLTEEMKMWMERKHRKTGWSKSKPALDLWVGKLFLKISSELRKGFYSRKSPGMQLPAQLWEEGEETNIPLQTLRNKNDMTACMRLHSWVLSLLKLLDLFQRTIGWVRLRTHGVAFEPSQWWREGIVGAFSPLAIVSKRGNF